MARRGIRQNGFSSIGATAAALVVTVMVFVPRLYPINEYLAVRTEANLFVEQLKDAQRIAVGSDTDQRIRLTSERGFIRERRAGAGWLFEQAYALPDGLEISGPRDIEFFSRGVMGPAALYSIESPKGLRREIILTNNRSISVQ
jgi:hypothetical protein